MKAGSEEYDWSRKGREALLKKKIDSLELSGKESILVQKGIISILKDSLENIEVAGNEVGIVNSIGDGIVYVDGIDHAMYGEVVIFENGQKAMVQDVREDEVGCILFDDEEEIEEGTKVIRSGRMAGIPVGDEFIGRVVMKIAKALDMNILIYTRTPRADEDGVRYVDLETVLKNSDYVSLHCPLTPQTRHMINKETLALMKPTAFLINTSRGALVDEPALIEALENHQIAGAGLDVQETEPPKEDNPLYTLDNVILTPHMGWKGLETRQRLVSILAGNVKGFLAGTPVNVVS